jgi:hypothetical protein
MAHHAYSALALLLVGLALFFSTGKTASLSSSSPVHAWHLERLSLTLVCLCTRTLVSSCDTVKVMVP